MDIIFRDGGSQVNVQRTISIAHFEFWVTSNKIYY